MSELTEYAERVRSFYEDDNEVGVLLDDLLADTDTGVLSADVAERASAMTQTLGNCTATKVINRLVAALNA